MKIYYDNDADINIIQGINVTIIGYGSQGHAHANNLNDSGVNVTVGLREGSSSWSKAEAAGLNVQNDEELVKAASNYAQTIFHPVGTCKMGNDENSVVNDRLIAHGIENLRIVDASIMPNITSGNTNAPTIMIAEKASDMIIEDSRS